ncbi:MAG TPA: response regulator [Tepidisphaeraceae bacterium]|jgi:FixJ family two-component response regulator|nr:response regulator [Tepidisphaeraceae bacterium]
MSDEQPIVHVVDDDPGMRQSTALLLQSAGLACATYASAAQFLAACRPTCPGCLILDLQLPGMCGIDLVEQLRTRGIALPILIVSGTGTIHMAVQGMKLGVLDFLEKPVDPQTLLAKVRSGLELDAQNRAADAELRELRDRFTAVTSRERELLKLLVDGLSSKQIASTLGISIKTVENHRTHLMEKTRAMNIADLVRMSMLIDAHK